MRTVGSPLNLLVSSLKPNIFFNEYIDDARGALVICMNAIKNIWHMLSIQAFDGSN